jgi:hypothetical protein
MSPNCKKSYLAGVAMSCLMAVVAPTADATLMLSGSINGSNFCASDQNVGCGFGVVIPDGNPAVNQLGVAEIIINGVQAFNSQHIATYGPPQNILNSSSLQVINTNNFAVDILVTVSATDFLPASLTAFVSGSGTFQNVAEDPNDTPGNLLDSFGIVAPIAPFSFAHNGGPFNVVDLLPYSMTLQFHVTLPVGAELVSRGQTINKDVAQIPEPASLLLFGTGLGLLAWRFRKVSV